VLDLFSAKKFYVCSAAVQVEFFDRIEEMACTNAASGTTPSTDDKGSE